MPALSFSQMLNQLCDYLSCKFKAAATMSSLCPSHRTVSCSCRLFSNMQGLFFFFILQTKATFTFHLQGYSGESFRGQKNQQWLTGCTLPTQCLASGGIKRSVLPLIVGEAKTDLLEQNFKKNHVVQCIVCKHIKHSKYIWIISSDNNSAS